MMKPTRAKTLLLPLLAAVLLSACAATREARPAMGEEERHAIAAVPGLAAFEGVYRYRDGERLAMVAQGGRLIALIGEAKYPLRAVGPDTFANGSGDILPFERSAAGQVLAFRERGERFERLSEAVAPATRALLLPRPPGADGHAQPYRCAAPAALDDGLRVGSPGPQTLSCDLAAQIVNGVLDGSYPDVRAIAVHHRGALVLEEYFYGYDRDRPHQMRSLTKSVIALLAGAAVDRGLLRADEPALERLGYAAVANPDARKARITLSHLLSNTSGLACDDRDRRSPGNEVKLYESADWPKAFMDLPMLAEPGTLGRYCSFGIIAAGRMIESAAGQRLPAFAQAVLLEPLGIRPSQWRWDFVLDRSHRNDFGQIHLRPRDMLKLGLLIAQDGAWQGRPLISAAWIQAAVAKQSRVDGSDYGLGLWHRWYSVATAQGRQRVDTLMLSGNGGQKVFVVPTLDLVVVLTGGAFNAESPANQLMAQVLLPALLGLAPPAGQH